MQRRQDGTWLLLGAPVGVDVEPGEVVRQRRRLMPTSALEHELSPEPAAPEPAAPRLAANVIRMRESLRVLRENADDRSRVLRELCDQAALLHERTVAVRAHAEAARQRRAG